MTPAAKKGKYDTKFKQQVIQFAERFSNRAAGTKFGLNESTIRGWRKVKKAASTPPATPPPPRGHHAAAHMHPQQQHHGWQAPLAACCAPATGEPQWHEPARALAASDAASLYRKHYPQQQPHGPSASEPPSPARGAAAPAFLSHEYYQPAAPPAAAAPPVPSARRVLLRGGGEYGGGGGFPEVAVPFTVIAEKALRALCDQRGEAAPTGGSVTNRELFASFLGLTPNRLVDNVT